MKTLSTQKLADALETEGRKILEASARVGDLADTERTLKEVQAELSMANQELTSVLGLLDQHTEQHDKLVAEATAAAEAITRDASQVAERMIQGIKDDAKKIASKARAAAEQEEENAREDAAEARGELAYLEASLSRLSEVSENTLAEIAERQTALDSLNAQLLTVREQFKHLT